MKTCVYTQERTLMQRGDSISKGKLLTKDLALDTFHIGVDDVIKCVVETIHDSAHKGWEKLRNLNACIGHK